MKKAVLLSLLIIYSAIVLGQNEPRRINVNYTDEEIVLDGRLDEAAWQTADTGSDFWQFFPTDSALSVSDTEFKLLYNDETLYVGIRAESATGRYVVSSLRRDFGGTSNDNVTLMFDTFRDGTTAFMFGITPYGVKRDGFISEGGAGNGFNNTWDQKWQAESTMHDDYYMLEAAIPFSSIKFGEGDQTWNLKVYRWDMATSEQSTWARVPQNQMLSNLAFAGEMVFEKPLDKSRTPIAVIPYINALTSKDFVNDFSDNNFKFGGDAKVAIGNSMNLDITVNPDFSNVEVDDIFTNLTRFEVFLPERRQFFIDNSDLFGNFGDANRAASPFFSRRIGLARNANGNLIENGIMGGVRLSGKLNENWRLGFLNIQTDEDIANEIASNNNMMFVLQKRVFSRSNIGVFAINRQSFKDYDFISDAEEYNRVIGAEYNLASADNSWSGKFYLHKSFQPDDTEGNLSSQASLTYNNRTFQVSSGLTFVDQDYRADLGFVPRAGILRNRNSFNLNFYPEASIVNQHGPGISATYYWSQLRDFEKTDHNYELSYDITFTDQSRLNMAFENRYVFLLFDFDPTRTFGAVPIPGNQGYTYNQYSIQYQSNPAGVFSINAQTSGGEFYNGNNFTAQSTLNLRFQPYVSVSLNLRYDAIRLPEPHAEADFWLVAPELDVTFSKSLFWSTLVQYSNQRDNLGINSRLQWRFAPLSDLYLVYNDNYFTEDFGPKFRSVNLKVTYWLNI